MNDCSVSCEEYNTLLSSIHISISRHLLDEQLTVIQANRFYYDMTGYTEEEYKTLFHNHCSEYFKDDPAEYATLLYTLLNAFRNGDAECELICHMPQKGGNYIWIRLVGTLTKEKINGIPVIYAVYTDVSNLVQAQKERNVTFDKLPGFVAKFRVHDGFQLLYAHDRFLEFFGSWTKEDHFPSLVYPQTEENRKIIAENYGAMRQGKPVQFVVQGQKRDGGDAWLQVNADCVDWQNEDPIYLVVYIDITDITELLALKKELEQRSELLVNALSMAEHANRAKSDFLSRMSHDIRTPMNAILGMITIAKESLDDPARVADCLNKEEKAAKFLLSLINDILDMSKIESGKMVLRKNHFELKAFIENIAMIFQGQAQEHELNFAVHVDENANGAYFGDELKLNQILINLLGNAMKFTKADGRVELSVRPGKRKEQWLELIFTIKDTGIGMEKDFLNNIFMPFEQDCKQRESLGGSGLGLAIAANFARMMKGFIDVQSELNVGSVFTTHVWLEAPAEQSEENGVSFRQSKLKKEAKEIRFDGERILLVEDNEINSEIAEVLLTSRNLIVETAKNGMEALQLFKKRKAGYYFAILMDIQMPVMNGLDAAREIRGSQKADAKAVPIIAMSANAFDDDLEKSFAAGMNGHISKPIDISALFGALSQFLKNESEK